MDDDMKFRVFAVVALIHLATSMIFGGTDYDYVPTWSFLCLIIFGIYVVLTLKGRS